MDFMRAQCEAMVASLPPEVLRELGIPIGQWRRMHAPGEMLLRSFPNQWAWLEASRARKAETLKLLTAEQRVRMEELTLQWQGAVCAFLRPAIAAKLQLSAEQSRRIEAIFTLYRD